MRKLALALALFASVPAFADQSGREVVGRWKTVDDKTHQTESIMKIWVDGDKLYGAIDRLIGYPENQLCDRCSGAKKNQKMKGLILFSGLSYDGHAWDHGEIMDPKDGKVYRCKIELDSDGALKVRGYVGVAAFGRTQRWFRAE